MYSLLIDSDDALRIRAYEMKFECMNIDKRELAHYRVLVEEKQYKAGREAGAKYVRDQYAKANPDVIVEYHFGIDNVEIRRAKCFVYDGVGTSDLYFVQVELGKFVPITEIECV